MDNFYTTAAVHFDIPTDLGRLAGSLCLIAKEARTALLHEEGANLERSDQRRARQFAFTMLYKYLHLPYPVIGASLCLGGLARHPLHILLSSSWCFEEQTGSVSVCYKMAEITTVSRVAVVLEILSASWIGRPETVLLWILCLEFCTLLCALCGCRDRSSLRLEAVDGVHVALHDLLDGEVGVIAREHGSTQLLHCTNGFRACARDHNIDGCFQLLLSSCEQLDAIFHAVETPRFAQFSQRDGLCWIQTALVDPVLYAV